MGGTPAGRVGAAGPGVGARTPGAPLPPEPRRPGKPWVYSSRGPAPVGFGVLAPTLAPKVGSGDRVCGGGGSELLHGGRASLPVPEDSSWLPERQVPPLGVVLRSKIFTACLSTIPRKMTGFILLSFVKAVANCRQFLKDSSPAHFLNDL